MELADLISDNTKWALGICVALILTLAAHRLALWRDRAKTAHKTDSASPESEGRNPRPRYRINDGSIPLTPLSYSLRFDTQRPGGVLTLADGTKARMNLEVVCRIVNPHLAVFGTADAHFMDTLTPVIYSRVHQLVEAHSLPNTRATRKQTESLLRAELEPEFKKYGVTIEGLFIGALEPLPAVEESLESPVEPTSLDPPLGKGPTKHIVEYIINFPLDPVVTPEEVSILRRFSKFPRGQRTQGYRLDWIFEELLSDISASTAHLILENLLAKGYLERWTTRLGNMYYRISDNGRHYLVDNRLVQLNDA